METSRHFDRRWKFNRQHGSNGLIDRFDLDYTFPQVMQDFLIYCEIMKEDLELIKRFDKKTFDANSTSNVSIDEYLDMFYSTTESFFFACANKDAQKEYMELLNKPNVTNSEKFDFIYKELPYVSSFKKDFFDITRCENGADLYDISINNKYYDQIEKITNQIFMLEEIVSNTSKKIWLKTCAQSFEEINPKSNYACLVKIISDWRTDKKNASFAKYMDSRKGMSVSFVTQDKSKFFKENPIYGNIGLIFSASEIIGTCCQDAYTEEYINGKCPLMQKEVYSNIFRTSKKGEHEIFSIASKILTPNTILRRKNSLTDSFNEVIIDKDKSKPIGVFYISKIDNKKIKNLPVVIHEAKKIAERLNLPIIELESKNLLLKCTNKNTEQYMF